MLIVATLLAGLRGDCAGGNDVHYDIDDRVGNHCSGDGGDAGDTMGNNLSAALMLIVIMVLAIFEMIMLLVRVLMIKHNVDDMSMISGVMMLGMISLMAAKLVLIFAVLATRVHDDDGDSGGGDVDDDVSDDVVDHVGNDLGGDKVVDGNGGDDVSDMIGDDVDKCAVDNGIDNDIGDYGNDGVGDALGGDAEPADSHVLMIFIAIMVIMWVILATIMLLINILPFAMILKVVILLMWGSQRG